MRIFKSFRYITYLLIVMAYAGCASSGPVHLLPVAEKKIWVSQETRPDWLNKEPESKNGTLFFIGLSDKAVMEKDARNNAQQEAIKKVVQYIGVNVKSRFEKLVTATGLSTEIIDPTRVMKEFDEQLSSAVARRVKPSEWYIEKWERKQGPEVSDYYLISLLATVPQSEVDKVIAEQEAYQAALLKQAQTIREQLIQVKELILQADKQVAGQPVQAVNDYQAAIQQAEKAKVLLQGYPELDANLSEIDSLIKPTEGKLAEIMKNPWTIFTAAVLSLAKNAAKPITVAVAKVGYEDTDSTSEFGNYLTQRLEEIMSQTSVFFNVIAQPVFQKELQKAQLPIEDCLTGKFTPEKEPIIARLKGLIFAKYRELPAGIAVKLDLIEIGQGTLLGSTSIELPKASLPENMAYRPANNAIAEQGLSVLASTDSKDKQGLKIKVWADKGEGALYKSGELVHFFFRSNKDCYIYLYHMDASGQVKLLFPNSFSKHNDIRANQVYTIPDETMNFDLTIGEPFGVEMVKAFASLQPIKDLEIQPGEVGFREIGKITDSKTQEVITRGIQAVPKTGYAENTCTITTIK